MGFPFKPAKRATLAKKRRATHVAYHCQPSSQVADNIGLLVYVSGEEGGQPKFPNTKAFFCSVRLVQMMHSLDGGGFRAWARKRCLLHGRICKMAQRFSFWFSLKPAAQRVGYPKQKTDTLPWLGSSMLEGCTKAGCSMYHKLSSSYRM